MERVKFDLRFKEDIVAGKAKVETRDGQSVRIVCYDWCDKYPLMGKIDDDQSPILWLADGSFSEECECELDLFVVSDEPLKDVDIPEVDIVAIICSDKPLNLDSQYISLGCNRNHFYKCYTDNPMFVSVWNIKAIEDLFEIDKKRITNDNPDAFLVMGLYVVQRNEEGEILTNRIIKL